METMRVLIVEDEPLSQTALANILSARSDVEHFDSANDASEALEKLTTDSYNVLLLDVEMPEVSRSELVDQLRKQNRSMSFILFVTPPAEDVIAAFEKHTVDYVLKPISAERICEALDRASRRTEGERAVRLIEALPQLRRLSSRPLPTRMAIRTKGRILFFDPREIIAVQAEGNYVLLQRKSESYLLKESLSEVAEKLKPYGFIRIHRSVLINTSFVEEVQPYLTGSCSLRMTGGREYTLTRTYRKNLRSLAEFWIGRRDLPD
jgi:two-component system LytT family response regulator